MLKRIIVIVLVFFIEARGQHDSTFVIPDASLKAGNIHKFIFGQYWREAWSEKINVKKISANAFSKDFYFIKKILFNGVNSFLFRDKNNNSYIFTPLMRSEDSFLPDELKHSLAKDIIHDQISITFPASELIAYSLLNTISEFNLSSELLIISNQTIQHEYENKPGVFINLSFDFDQLISLQELDDKKKFNALKHVDAEVYLKYRLLDILLGDWNRNKSNILWLPNQGNYIPVITDYSKSFSIFDGLIPTAGEILVLPLTSFNSNLPGIKKITWQARDLDQIILPKLNYNQWMEVTLKLIHTFNGQTIKAALRSLPEHLFKKYGNLLFDRLMDRRNELLDFADKYYEFINKYADIYCTDKDDSVAIIMQPRKTNIKVIDTEDGKKEILINRTFTKDKTEEVRLYLLNGHDIVSLNGNGNEIDLKIIATDGKDNIKYKNEQKSNSKGFPSNIILYSKNDADNSDLGNLKIISRELPSKDSYTDKGNYLTFLPIANVTSNEGIVIGGGPVFTKYSFGLSPFDFKISLTGDYSSRPNSYRLNLEGIFNNDEYPVETRIKIHKSKRAFSYYYGYGLSGSINKGEEYSEKYQLDNEIFRLSLSIKYKFSNQFFIDTGMDYEFPEINVPHLNLLDEFPNGTYGIGRFRNISLNFSTQFDNRNHLFLPLEGIMLEGRINFYPKILDNLNNFSRVSAKFQYNYTEIFTNSTISIQGGFGRTFGIYPFFKAQFFGGENDLPGYTQNRFSATTNLYGNLEYRNSFGTLEYIIPLEIGPIIKYDLGYLAEHEYNFSKPLNSFSIGLWGNYMDGMAAFKFFVSHSNEGNYYYFLTYTNF